VTTTPAQLQQARSVIRPLPQGIYEALLDERLQEVLLNHPELRSVFGKLDPEEEPSRYSNFVSKVLEQALRLEADPAVRLRLCNELIGRIVGTTSEAPTAAHLVQTPEPLLLEITPAAYAQHGVVRPETGLSESCLFTGSPTDPTLLHELDREMRSADGVDVLVSFIKWSGLRLLMSAFEELSARGARLRLITTSYMGASDPEAVEWIAKLPNAEVRVSFDSERTRLHAKAYHFKRYTGFSTAYIGSANMSQAAMTSGLEWNLKITTQDMAHVLEKFVAEFETYWNSREFVPFDPEQPQALRESIRQARNRTTLSPVLFELRPHPFQERILDALQAERTTRGNSRNLLVAATGTGKTVVAAFDFRRFFEEQKRRARLLYVAHRREILEQAAGTFRNVLRIPDFGELLVGPHSAARLDHLFCSVDILRTRRIWEQVGPAFYDYVVVDEVHHGPADIYRPIFREFRPQILLGLTATPERMDGQSVAADFDNRFAAEIRLPEALDEKLLCPFHYFGVADPVSLSADRYWRNGKYDVTELENLYTGAHVLALQRLDVIINALLRYEPDLERVRGIGFCVSVRHAEFMAARFNDREIPSEVLVGETHSETRAQLLTRFREGELRFLFTRDVLNEGLDIPDINTVLFLRPTESLTVFLQQLGRGLRHAPGKDCLTVLDFVGQVHRRYQIARKLKALLSGNRIGIDREVELDFPHLPPGCSIQFDRIARAHVLENIRENLKNLSQQVPERLETFERESGLPLTFGNFVRYHDYEPEILLKNGTWSEWKARARLAPSPADPDLRSLRRSLINVAQAGGPREIRRTREVLAKLTAGDLEGAVRHFGDYCLPFHFRIWGRPGPSVGFPTLRASFERLSLNPRLITDLQEVLEWREEKDRTSGLIPELGFPCLLELHASYSNNELKAHLKAASFKSAGITGVGLLHCMAVKAYALLITFQKTEREFSPTTMYADYPLSRDLLHWESPSNTAQLSETGQNLIAQRERGYTVLLFARARKKRNGFPVPFTYLGPADRETHQRERPIQITWRLRHLIPAEMYEENRRGA
jgi:superfamily II DNA or RNA helicase